MDNFVGHLLLPFALFMVMLRVGLSLELDYLQKAVKNKKPIIIGLITQMILLPASGFVILYFLDLPFEIEIGILIIMVCPGGWVSNLLSSKLKADVNLSIALTTFSSLLSVFTTPFYIYLSLFLFYPHHCNDFSIPMITGQISLWVVVPALLGVIFHYKNEKLAENLLKFVRPTSIIFIIFIVIGAAITEGEHFSEYFKKIGITLFLINAFSMLTSYYFARFLKCEKDQSMTISIETGVQNSTLAIVVSMSIMDNVLIAIPPTIYTIIMYATVSFLLFFHKNKEE